jgi:hypothetical protein
MADSSVTPKPEMPDPQRRKIVTALVTAAAIAAPAAKVLLAKVPGYGTMGY